MLKKKDQMIDFIPLQRSEVRQEVHFLVLLFIHLPSQPGGAQTEDSSSSLRRKTIGADVPEFLDLLLDSEQQDVLQDLLLLVLVVHAQRLQVMSFQPQQGAA